MGEADGLVPPTELGVVSETVEAKQVAVRSANLSLSPVQEVLTETGSTTFSPDRQPVDIARLAVVGTPEDWIGPGEREGAHHHAVDHADVDFVTLDARKDELLEALGPLVDTA